MKNANKPAMPQPITSGYGGLDTTYDYNKEEAGLTKLEHFALKIHCATISHHGKACFNASIDEAGRFLKEFEK